MTNIDISRPSNSSYRRTFPDDPKLASTYSTFFLHLFGPQEKLSGKQEQFSQTKCCSSWWQSTASK